MCSIWVKSSKMTKINSLSNSKSICILIVVIGCFAILWPKIFYPMLMCGLNWNKDKFSFERDVSDKVLPPKVREAMKLNPVRETAKPQNKLPGRPQFYAGNRPTSKTTQSGSMMNIAMPVYTILIVLFFIYTIFKLSVGNDDKETPMNNVAGCSKCNYNRNWMHKNRKSKDPYLSRSSYKAFSMYGCNNVSRNLYSLIRDMEIFRDQLVKAEICQCKLQKYEIAIKATENCLEKMTNENLGSTEIEPDENIEENIETKSNEEETQTESTEEQDSDISVKESDEVIYDSDKENVEEHNDNIEEENKENNPKRKISETIFNKKDTGLKQRKKLKKNTEIDFKNMEADKLSDVFDKKTLKRLNRELDRLMNEKNE